MIQESGRSPSSPASGSPPAGFRFGVFELDLAAGELRKDGRLTRIRNQPLKVLSILLANPGAIVTREDLYKELWQADEIVDFDQGLNHSIREIRAILGDNADSPRFIQTLPRRGYRFLAEVRPIPPAQLEAPGQGGLPGNESRAASLAHDPVPRRSSPHSSLRRGFAAAVLAAAGFSLSAWLLRMPATASTSTLNGTSPTPRLLVLPFAAASRDTEDDLVADGLTDEVIARVGRRQGGRLTVLGRTSSMEYKGRAAPLAELRAGLGVTHVLEGRVQRTPQGLRALASLSEASSGARLWTLDDRSHANLWSFQESVADRIARGIDGALELPVAHRRQSPLSVEANLNYLRGRAQLANRDHDSLEAALRGFEACVQSEPTFAPGWASLAETRIVLMDHGLADPATTWPAVKAAADRALTLDPDLAEGWNLLAAYFSLAAANEAEARRALERALSLNPNLVAAHHWNGIRLIAAGRPKEAEVSIRRALALDPLAAVLHGNLGDALAAQGRSAEALREFDIALDLRPDWPLAHVWKGRALGREGRWPEAVTAFQRGATGENGAARAYLIGALVKTGDLQKARAVWAQMNEPDGPYTAPYYKAVAAFSLGDRDAAIAALRKTVAERSPLVMRIGHNEEWKGFETDPRFLRLVEILDASRRSSERVASLRTSPTAPGSGK